MWGHSRLLSTTFLQCQECITQSKRTAYVLKRKFDTRLNKMNAIFPRKLKRRDFYYEVVENTDRAIKPPIEIVLTTDVPGIGMKGEKMKMNMFTAYTELLLPKLAVYASSAEAQQLLTSRDVKHYSSKYSKIVKNFLAGQAVEIILSNDVQWMLQPWHVKVALRKNGILTNEDCITIPKEISGPSYEIENKDFLVYVTMNKSEKFPLRCRIHLWSTLEPKMNLRHFDLNSSAEPLFPDEKEMIDSLIKTAEEIKKNQMLKQGSQAQQMQKMKKRKK